MKAAAASLKTLPAHERFVTAMLLGLSFPKARGALTAALDDSLADGELQWHEICDERIVTRWVVAGRELDAALCVRVVTRAEHRTVGRVLLEAVRERLQHNDTAGAEVLFAAIDQKSKLARSSACALLWLATRDDEWSRRAIDDCVGTPKVQVGNDEADALAAVLGEYQRAGLAADTPAVVNTVAALVDWGDSPDLRYICRDGYYWGVQNCVRAGWLDHARRLRTCWLTHHDDPLDKAIATGIAEDPPQRQRPTPGAAEVLAEPDRNQQLVKATAYAEGRYRAEDLEGAYQALAGVVAAGDRVPATAGAEEQAEWALALAVGGAQAEALAVVVGLASGEVLPRTACDAALKLAELGGDALAFVDAAIANGHAKDIYGDHYPPEGYAATYLGRIVARTDDLDRELALVRAVRTERPTHVPEPGLRDAGPLRETLRVLSDRHPQRLSRWLDEVGPEMGPYVAGAAVRPLAEVVSLATIIAIRGGDRAWILSQNSYAKTELQEMDIRALTTGLASQGRLDDALELLRPYRPLIAQDALYWLCETVRTSDDRARIISVYRGRKLADFDRDLDQGWDDEGWICEEAVDWTCKLGRMLLFDGQIDEAIAIAADQPKVKHPYERAELLRQIGTWLDANDGWTPARRERILRILCGPTLTAGTVMNCAPQIIPGAITGDPELSLTELADKLYLRQWRTPLFALAGVGDLRAGRRHEGMAEISEQVLDKPDPKSNRWVPPPRLLWCVQQVPRDVKIRDELFLKVFRMLEWDLEDALKNIRAMLGAIEPADLAIAARALAESELPVEIRSVGEQLLGELVVAHSEDATLLPIESAQDPITARQRVQQAARFLARHGELDAARRLAEKSGLVAAG
ncbi:hypothetical protein GII30_12070 [Gordonia amarae]|uniref:Uncharacterized protein n=1 Tax=Gordonia amarae TaxID=36821 RepID=A0A857KXI2_9ACTN|nr:hypothetical protein [Gordonia amarae]MCS3879123.1 hypothetical protein [Gordonia amarae]QHN17652.1 hypothetical protein GII35_12280 [Gordonia amarae]QHN22178.1 hypothetical protein GII34_12060 [Gordonia amarae]QHN31059.1 hypothetical protein GII32_12235 [Gordonia amarae]QHN39804.1 hypothetical protein GII30_12070 [Gordonia amarae]